MEESEEISEIKEAVTTGDVTVEGSGRDAPGPSEELESDTVVEPAGATMINVLGASPEIVSDQTTDDLKLILGEFEGPMDLLLHLIRHEQINIYDIPVALITDQYLRYLQVMQEMDIA